MSVVLLYLFTGNQITHAFCCSLSDLIVILKHVVLDLRKGFLFQDFHSVEKEV